MITSLQAANILIQKSLDDGKPLTHMQIQKILYYLQGWHDVVFEQRLIQDDALAWKNGPVFEPLYRALGHMDSDVPVTALIPDVPDADDAVSAKQHELIGGVKEFYGRFSGKRLSVMTHLEDAPWFQVYVDQGKPDAAIPYAIIAKHFNQLHEEEKAKQKAQA